MALKQLSKIYSTDFRLPNKKPIGSIEPDLSNKYGARLEAGYLFKETEYARDITGRYGGDWGGSSSATSLQHGLAGQYLSFSGSATSVNRFNIDSSKLRELFDGAKPFTIVFYAKTESTGSNRAVFGIEGSDDLVIYLSEGTNLEFRVFWRDAGGTVGSFNQIGTKYQGKWNRYIYTFDGVDDHNIFINNDNVDNSTFSGAGAGTYSSGPTIGGYSAATVQYFDGDIASFFIFNSCFKGDIQGLTQNLYQILKPKQVPAYFTADGGGGTLTITEAVSTLNMTSVDPVIDFTGLISIVEGSEPLNITSIDPTVTLTATLTITESTSTLNIANNDPDITLTAPDTLVITESTATLNITTQSPNITLSGTLSIVESTKTIDMLTRDPSVTLGLPVYTQTFTGIQKAAEFTGTTKLYGFTGTITELQTFSGTAKAASFLGVTE
jgi:hypothetical protein